MEQFLYTLLCALQRSFESQIIWWVWLSLVEILLFMVVLCGATPKFVWPLYLGDSYVFRSQTSVACSLYSVHVYVRVEKLSDF